MTREEAIKWLKLLKISPLIYGEYPETIDMAIEALQFAEHFDLLKEYQSLREVVYCKDCKYFELDHFDRIDDMPIITAHEICTKWSGGCKTSKDGFCFMGAGRE